MKHFRIAIIALLLLLCYRVFSQQPPALVPYRDGGLWGYANPEGKIVVPLQYEEAYPFVTYPEMFAPNYNPEYPDQGWPGLQHPVALVKKDGLYGLLDAEGNELTPPVSPAPFFFAPLNGGAYQLRYDAGDMDENGYATMRLAVLTASGQRLTPFRYNFGYDDDLDEGWGDSDIYGHSSFFSRFQEEREAVVVRKGERFGLVSSVTGDELNAPVWNSILPGGKGISIAYSRDTLPLAGFSGEGYYLVGQANRILRKLDGINYAAGYSCGLFQVTDQVGRFGFINIRGESVIPVSFTECYGFSDDGVAKVRTADGLWQIIDTTGAVKMTLGPEGGCWKEGDSYFILEADGHWYVYDRYFRKTIETGFENVPYPVELCKKSYFQVYVKGQKGLVNTAGQTSLPALYETSFEMYDVLQDRYGRLNSLNGLFVSRAGKNGVLDCELREIVPLLFERIELFYGPDLWLVQENGKSGIYDTKKRRLLFPVRFDEIKLYPDSDSPYYAIRQGDYWGKFDTAGREIFPVIFEQEFFEKNSRGMILVKSKRGWHLFDRDREEISFLGNLFDDPRPSVDDQSQFGGPPMIAITAKVNGKKALFDHHGKTLIPPVYDNFQLRPDHVLVQKDGKWGALSYPGLREIVPIKYLYIQYDAGKYRLYEQNRDDFVWYDPATGSRRVAPKGYSSIQNFGEGMALVQHNCIFGFIDTSLREVVPLQYTYAYGFSEGLAAVKTTEGRWGYLNREGTFAIPPRFLKAESFRNGTAVVVLQHEPDTTQWYTLIDRNGRELRSVEAGEGTGIYRLGPYIVVRESNERQTVLDSTMQVVLNNCTCLSDAEDDKNFRYFCDGRAGILTPAGEKMSNEQNFSYQEYPGGLTGVQYCNVWGLQDNTGRWIIPLAEQSGSSTGDGKTFYVWRNGHTGLFDADGKQLVPVQYDLVERNGEYWQVYKNNMQGIFDGKGRLIVPAEYTSVELYPAIGLIKVVDEGGQTGFFDFSGRRYFR